MHVMHWLATIANELLNQVCNLTKHNTATIQSVPSNNLRDDNDHSKLGSQLTSQLLKLHKAYSLLISHCYFFTFVGENSKPILLFISPNHSVIKVRKSQVNLITFNRLTRLQKRTIESINFGVLAGHCQD